MSTVKAEVCYPEMVRRISLRHDVSLTDMMFPLQLYQNTYGIAAKKTQMLSICYEMPLNPIEIHWTSIEL